MMRISYRLLSVPKLVPNLKLVPNVQAVPLLRFFQDVADWGANELNKTWPRAGELDKGQGEKETTTSWRILPATKGCVLLSLR
jgi:hypothetical protein